MRNRVGHQADVSADPLPAPRGETPRVRCFVSIDYSKFTTSKPVTTDMCKTAGAVPEPTSGLLLLIGVAGIALRRRRA